MRHEVVDGLPPLLIATGLIVEAITLTASNPVFFSLFLVGGLLVASGTALVLWRLARPSVDR